MASQGVELPDIRDDQQSSASSSLSGDDSTIVDTDKEVADMAEVDSDGFKVDAPSAVAYDEIVRRLSNHFSPRLSVTVQRFKFGTRQQQPGESIADYIAELRRLSEHCDFGASLDDMLRDRLVCGVRSETLQLRLLAEPELTFATAREKAIAMGSAQRQTEQIRGSVTSSEVCSPAVRVEVRVNGSPLEMEVDSGAVCSVINDRTMRKLRISKRALHPSSLHPRAYNNKELRVLGELTVTVEFRGQENRLRLVVVKGARIGLTGRDWFKSLGISLSGVHSVC
ncbi:uncharacterized protein [Dermacentor albipictus]|uniref:uncharacterized protein n=1 Tax=Dermacentor albipictus TaxID=60249 RepID=UPI0038FBEB2A